MTAYRIDLTKFIDWLDSKSVAAFAAERAHIELYARWSETQGLAPATIGRSLSTICGFYTYCTEKRRLERPSRTAGHQCQGANRRPAPSTHQRSDGAPTDTALGIDIRPLALHPLMIGT